MPKPTLNAPAMVINNKEGFRAFREQLKEELEGFLAARGLTMDILGAGFLADGLQLRINFQAKAGASEDAEGEARERWAALAPAYGLPADAYGKVIRLRQTAFRLVAIDPKKQLNNVRIARVHDGKVFICKVSVVKAGLAML